MKLSKIYKEVLNEELTYRHANTHGPEDDEYKIGMVKETSIDLPNLRMPNEIVNISNDEKIKINNLNPTDLIISQGEFDGHIANMIIKVPWKSEINNNAIIVDIQIINIKANQLYQVHISLAKEIRGLGLGYKIYVALINDLGHLYSGKGRQLNNSEIPHIWNKLNSYSGIGCYKNDNGVICMLNNNPNKENLLKLTGND